MTTIHKRLPRVTSFVFLLNLCFLSFALATVYPTAFSNVSWDNENWILRTTLPDPGHYQSRASVSNGYIGISVSSLGPFFEADTPVNADNVNGWPLFDRRQTLATVAGFYDAQSKTNETNFESLNQLGAESIISGIPHWSGLLIQCNGHVLNASTPLSQIVDFSSTLHIKSASQSWSYVWKPPGGTEIRVEYVLIAHKLHINQATVRLKVTSTSDANITVADVLDGDAALRTIAVDEFHEADSNMIWTAVQPINIPYVTAYVYSMIKGDASLGTSSQEPMSLEPFVGANKSSIAQTFALALKSHKTSVIDKFVGIASTDAFSSPQKVAHMAAEEGARAGFNEMLKSHCREWALVMTPESVDNFSLPHSGSLPNDQNLVEQQIQAVTNPYALLQNTVSHNAIEACGNNTRLDVNSIPVGGLASDSYGGLIFWDAEVWMAPGLVVSHPEAAKQITNYRVEKYGQALKNVSPREKSFSSQANTPFSPDAAIFPWTSARFGNCTGTGPCFDYEYHINGDIALALEHYYAVTGDLDTFEHQYFPIANSIAHTYSDLLDYNTSLSRYTLKNATDPDEYANAVSNPAYTMALIKTQLTLINELRKQFGMAPNDTWSLQAKAIEIPFSSDADIFLEYSGMNGSIVVKQADVALIDDSGFIAYPNQYSLADLNYYAGKQTLNGPGMTFGVFSVVASRFEPSGCSAYTYDLYGSQPYARAPWYQYSEQLSDDYTTNGGTHPAFPFLTGMGGANRVSVFGYLGLNLQIESLHVDPSLPPQIPHLAYRTLYWQGYAVKAVANKTHTIFWRIPEKDLPSANPMYKDPKPIPVTVGESDAKHSLYSTGKLTLSNRRPDLRKTLPGNLAQCHSATSDSPVEPGQIALSAVDGSISTSWQPMSAERPSTLTVTLGESGYVAVTGFAFNWAQNPPLRVSVYFANSSSATGSGRRFAISNDRVRVSDPYDFVAASLIAPYRGNSTNVTLSKPVWGGKYAMLTIEGNHALNATEDVGASVAEFAIFGM